MFSKLFSRVRQIVAILFVGVRLTATAFAQDNPINTWAKKEFTTGLNAPHLIGEKIGKQLPVLA
jgi:hypothetical protein